MIGCFDRPFLLECWLMAHAFVAWKILRNVFACVIFLRLVRFLCTFYFAFVFFLIRKTLRALRALREFEWKPGLRHWDSFKAETFTQSKGSIIIIWLTKHDLTLSDCLCLSCTIYLLYTRLHLAVAVVGCRLSHLKDRLSAFSWLSATSICHWIHSYTQPVMKWSRSRGRMCGRKSPANSRVGRGSIFLDPTHN